jgi:hypothetical protein
MNRRTKKPTEEAKAPLSRTEAGKDKEAEREGRGEGRLSGALNTKASSRHSGRTQGGVLPSGLSGWLSHTLLMLIPLFSMQQSMVIRPEWG